MEKFQRYFLDTIRYRYADFQGRASRSEYWYFVLFYFIIEMICRVIDAWFLNPVVLGATVEQSFKGGLLSGIVGLALFIPSMAVGVRRLHDIGRSGWWLLVGLIPILGALVLIYFFVQESKDTSWQK
ncbi:MAG: DUF805 domain-containing protein [Thermodesulfatator sp.]|nr:MAG: DUF805 domain-containing protein [Thermodesulfatator sp.]